MHNGAMYFFGYICAFFSVYIFGQHFIQFVCNHYTSFKFWCYAKLLLIVTVPCIVFWRSHN